MASKKIQKIPVYVKLKVQKDGRGEIRLYNDSQGKYKLCEPIRVHPPGARITFRPVRGKKCNWTFWNLTIHPLGAPTAAVDLDWYVTDDKAVLRDTTPREEKRTFSYTLALAHKNGTKYYLDPRLVNTGGG